MNFLKLEITFNTGITIEYINEQTVINGKVHNSIHQEINHEVLFVLEILENGKQIRHYYPLNNILEIRM
jgi:hypothetical protein